MAEANVWTCGSGLLEVLAREVLRGSLLAEAALFDLSQWTLLVPTRRAARLLERKLFELSGAAALVLPRVRPIGDGDEDLLDLSLTGEMLPPAISKSGQLFLLLSLIDHWARANPHIPLAADVNASPGQALGLAQSLVALVNQVETEEAEAEFSRSMRENFDRLELAEHRETIISLLNLVQDEMPTRLHQLGLMSPAKRRNAAIRLEGTRIAAGHHHGPIIAAGSTGTNPATRQLLKAIACHAHGAVVLPGLDLALDQESWDSLGPGHPQHAMHTLLAELAVDRTQVKPLGEVTARQHLLREVMRPAATTDRWFDSASLQGLDVTEATVGLSLVEAPDRHSEARAIAVLMREVLETPDQHAALITPDRNLGQQVTEELKRWDAAVDDSGGEPLIRFGLAQLAKLVMDAVAADFSPPALVGLLCHPRLTLGLDAAEARRLCHLFEIVCLRQDLPPHAPSAFVSTAERVRKDMASDPHASPMLTAVQPADWDALLGFSARFAAALQPVALSGSAGFSHHLDNLARAVSVLAPDADAPDALERRFFTVMEALRQETSLHPEGSQARAFTSITWALREETVRRLPDVTSRLSIYGLAEARLVSADLVILGGLNETVWPATVDPGPWVNRAMRAELGLAQPERDIGITAHDFAQGMAHPVVVATWSRRLSGTPLAPARWIMRLRALLEVKGITPKDQLQRSALDWAERMDAAAAQVITAMPKPRPPPAIRPRDFSVTEIETLIRDPYAIYARRILGLEALPALAGSKAGGLEAALRGTLIHAALAGFAGEKPGTSAAAEVALKEIGARVFANHMEHPEVRHFWWPRFVRMAAAFAAENHMLMSNVAATLVEAYGKISFDIAGIRHSLRARADRLDVMNDASVRIIDYKSGTAPSASQVETGLSPQLTLEAALLMHGGFGEGLPLDVADLIYFKVSGANPPAEVRVLTFEHPVASVASAHLEKLKVLLEHYQDPGQPYVPRAVVFKEREASAFDHLSRHAEWSRGGAP